MLTLVLTFLAVGLAGTIVYGAVVAPLRPLFPQGIVLWWLD